MKKILVTISVLIISVSLFAQEKYSILAKIGSGISMNSPEITPFTLEGVAYYNLTSHWAFGGGAGFGLYDDISVVPLCLNIKYIMNPKAKYNLFASCSAGYGFALGDGKKGGSLLNPEFGVQHKLWDQTFLVAIGYRLQKLERLKSNSNDYMLSQFTEELNLNSVSIKLGVIF